METTKGTFRKLSVLSDKFQIHGKRDFNSAYVKLFVESLRRAFIFERHH